eukprot:TRINITY_DN35184_c0_g1_i1.p1 TRINITY_DN35184_c0_g1~~TRINITY_DN35184_c0_g1_i1.p1  ORF type:complete len:685 (-),score=136.85 TRINITY_DN35184_c0_g1_i1:31-2085(-)
MAASVVRSGAWGGHWDDGIGGTVKRKATDTTPAVTEPWIPPTVTPIDWDVVEREDFQRAFIDDDLRFDSGDAETRRLALEVRVEDAAGCSVPAPVQTFEELDVFPEYLFQGLAERGITSPMPIQAQALPLVLRGHNVIGLAQTGSGKTLAFLLPAIVHIEAQQPLRKFSATPIALVLAPTRELAVQISDEAVKVLKYSKQGWHHRGGLWSCCLYGGGSKREQQRNLQGSHIVVATPGRLLDFLATQVISLDRVTYFVLDEADRMLDMGFHGDVTTISGQVRPERQVLFFSATWSKAVQSLAGGLCPERARPVRIAVGQRSSTEDCADGTALHQAREGIEQMVIVVDCPGEWELQAAKKRALLDDYLTEVLEESEENKILVFVSQKTLADELSTQLWDAGFQAAAMHGGKQQESRLWTLEQFRKGELRLLIATDVLGRGIDIPNVSHVVVFDMGTVEDYVHRIGRTARGRDGHGCATVFFEYYPKLPYIAAELIEVLEGSQQIVPEDLRRIAKEVAEGKREISGNGKWGGANGSNWWSKSGYSEDRRGGWRGHDAGNGGAIGTDWNECKDWRSRGSRPQRDEVSPTVADRAVDAWNEGEVDDTKQFHKPPSARAGDPIAPWRRASDRGGFDQSSSGTNSRTFRKRPWSPEPKSAHMAGRLPTPPPAPPRPPPAPPLVAGTWDVDP